MKETSSSSSIKGVQVLVDRKTAIVTMHDESFTTDRLPYSKLFAKAAIGGSEGNYLNKLLKNVVKAQYDRPSTPER